jgi:4-aminobutyrate aminotransferase-like enzyme
MAVLDEIEDRDLMGRARELGERLLHGLRELQARHPIIGDVRGRGLFLGFEMVRNQETLEPAADEAQALVDFMRDRGVLMSTDGPLHNVIKIKPPMVLNGEDVEITLKLLDEGLTSL